MEQSLIRSFSVVRGFDRQNISSQKPRTILSIVIRCMTRRARVRGSPCIVTIVKRPWGSQRDTIVCENYSLGSPVSLFLML